MSDAFLATGLRGHTRRTASSTQQIRTSKESAEPSHSPMASDIGAGKYASRVLGHYRVKQEVQGNAGSQLEALGKNRTRSLLATVKDRQKATADGSSTTMLVEEKDGFKLYEDLDPQTGNVIAARAELLVQQSSVDELMGVVAPDSDPNARAPLKDLFESLYFDSGTLHYEKKPSWSAGLSLQWLCMHDLGAHLPAREYLLLRFSEVFPHGLPKEGSEDEPEEATADVCGVSIFESVEFPDCPPLFPPHEVRRMEIRNAGFVVQGTSNPATSKITMHMPLPVPVARNNHSTERTWHLNIAKSLRRLPSTIVNRRLRMSKTVRPNQWAMRDSCNTCNQSFSMFRRQHHCRLCGVAVCSKCSMVRKDGNKTRICVSCGQGEHMIAKSSRRPSNDNTRASMASTNSNGSSGFAVWGVASGRTDSQRLQTPHMKTSGEFTKSYTEAGETSSYSSSPKSVKSATVAESSSSFSTWDVGSGSRNKMPVHHRQQSSDSSTSSFHENGYSLSRGQSNSQSGSSNTDKGFAIWAMPQDKKKADEPKMLLYSIGSKSSSFSERDSAEHTPRKISPSPQAKSSRSSLGSNSRSSVTDDDEDDILTSSTYDYPLSYAKGNPWPDAPIPEHEKERLALAKTLRLSQHYAQTQLKDLLELARSTMSCPVAGVAVIMKNVSLVVTAIGVAGDQMPRDVALEAHAIMSKEPLVILDALEDERFKNNPMVSSLHIRFYIAMPLVGRDGIVVGALTLGDVKPRKKVSGSTIRSLTRIASLAMDKLNSREEDDDRRGSFSGATLI